MWSNSLYDTTKLTVELSTIVENGVDIWAFDYPSFYQGDEKKAFEQKVLDHFWCRQIGFETVGRFLHYFRFTMREIMPYYIKIYELEKKLVEAGDPFQSYDLTETYNQTSSNHTTNNDNGSFERRFSNTPQGAIDNLDDYMTEAERNNTENESTGNQNGNIEHTLTRKGNIGVQPLGVEFTANWRAYINIDMMILEDLNRLFLGVY